MKVDEQLFTMLIDENKDKLFRICCYYVADDESRKDLYQEALINIWKGFSSFRGEASYLTWMLRITVNTALKFISKERSLQLKGKQYAKEQQQGVKEIDESMEQLNLLHRGISQLPLVDMIIISLFLEDTGSKEIAKITGLTDSNVRVRVHRAKAQLKKLIEGGEL